MRRGRRIAEGLSVAANNPVSHSDPTGLMVALTGGGGCDSSIPGCPGYTAPHASSSSTVTGSSSWAAVLTPRNLAALGPVVKAFGGSHVNWGNLAKDNFTRLPHVNYAALPSPAELKGIRAGVRYAQDIQRQQALEASAPSLWSDVAHGFSDAYHFAVNNRGTLLTLGAIFVCASGVGTAFCGGALAAAYIVRAQQRVEDYGFKRSLDANIADGVMTVGFALPMAGATITGVDALEENAAEDESLAQSAQLSTRIVTGVAAIPDAVQFVGGFLPGHVHIFFNGATLRW